MSAKLSSKWRELLIKIPGYDAVATAEDCHFDQAAAERVLEFYPKFLKHIKGNKAGQPFVLEIWQRAILANLFGWMRPDGTRRYRTGFIYVPRKNGKTPLAAGVAIYGLLSDGEPGAEIYSAAGDRAQARLVYQWVKGMVRAEPELNRRCRIYQNSIVEIDPKTQSETGSTYAAISAEASTKHGYNSHLVIIDELHAQPNRELVDVLETSTAARRQPLVIYITTADFNRESICNEIYDYACSVRDGILPDKSFLPVVYEATKTDDWNKPSTWQKANPNLGVSVTREYFDAKHKKARRSAAFENTFKRLHLNYRTESDVRWLDMPAWDRCGTPVKAKQLEGCSCYAGLDMSSSKDITAFVMVFEKNIKLYVVPRFWCPRDKALERSERGHPGRDKVDYLTWSKRGYIKLTPGNVIDYDVVRNDINKLGELYDITEIALDRWNASQLMTQLQGDGFEIVPFGQGFKSMSTPAKELETRILGGAVAHGGHPVLRWMAANCAVDLDPAENIKPSKKKSTERIDGIVALIMAIGRLIEKLAKKESVYKTRGLRTI